MKISLCMICGNEEGVIVRCLESAKGAFDELCLVRAIGNLEPDGTIEEARAWCAANGKDFRTDDYLNSIAQPGVDDFAAARNLSFSLPGPSRTCLDWLLWLDCDDYLDEVNCRRIREAVASVPEHWDAIMCAYVLGEQGAEIPRERLMRAHPANGGRPRWKSAIHETCTVESGPWGTGECLQIKVFHSDHRAKHQSSSARNLRILDRVLEEAPRQYFYQHAELKMLCKGNPAYKQRAIATGRAALELLRPEQMEERYQIRLNLSELEPARRIEHLLEAVRLQPHRREAFAYLCQASLIDGNISDATSYFRLLDALPMPSPAPLGHQGLWYGWARHFLRVRVLRAAGQKEEADKEHSFHLQEPEYAAGVAEYESGTDSEASV